MREDTNGVVEHNSTMVKDFLELGGGFSAPMRGQVRFTAQVDGIKLAPTTQFVRPRRLEDPEGARRIVAIQRKLGANGWEVIELDDCMLREAAAQILRQFLSLYRIA